VRNLPRVPKSAQPFVATIVRTVSPNPTPDRRIASTPGSSSSCRSAARRVAALLGNPGDELLSFTAFDRNHWREIRSTKPQKRFDRELRRRSDVVGIFPDRSSIVRLMRAVLAEQHDEWQVTNRYRGLEYLRKMTSADEVLPALAAASKRCGTDRPRSMYRLT
jgi:transposase-like protein